VGAFDEAERRFAVGLETHDRFGAPRLSAWTRIEWSRLLLLRDGPGDRGRAREFLIAAAGTARAAGLTNIEIQANAVLAAAG
jgi:hypothetical protein